MRVTFLTPHLRIAGGVRAILTYADRLAALGHDVTLVVPAGGRGAAWWRSVRGAAPEWMPGLAAYMLTQGGDLAYQGIKIVGAPSIDAGITSGTPDTTSVLLTYPTNLYAGYHRAMKFETWRDPREGVTSFVITARVDAEVAVVKATSLAYSVNVEP